MPYQPRASLDNPYGPQVTFRTEDVLPPTAVYLSPEDHVVVWVMTDVTVLTVYVQLRMLMPTGEIKIIPYTLSNPFTYDWYPALSVPPVEGYLLGAQCWSDNPQRGQCFVSVQLMRSAPPDLRSSGEVLLQGYINSLNVLTYPGSPIQSTFSGRGAFLTLTQPLQTGNNLFFGAPQYTLWRFYSLVFTFNTSAAVGNREVGIVVKDANNVIVGFWPATFTHPAGTSEFYAFSCGGVSSGTAPWVTIAGPTELFVPPRSSLQTSVSGLDAADSISSIGMQVEEWMGQ